MIRYFCYTCGEMDLLERGTLEEGICTENLQGFGERKGFKPSAIGKSEISDFPKASGKLNLLDCGAIIEGIVSDRGNSLLYNNPLNGSAVFCPN